MTRLFNLAFAVSRLCFSITATSRIRLGGVRLKHNLRALAVPARTRLLLLSLLTALVVLVATQSARAAITATGDVEPGNPSTWTSSTGAAVGNTTNGTLTVNGGSNLNSNYITAGNFAGVTGAINIDGAGSIWTTSFFYVGGSGTGTLAITNGAAVTSTYSGTTSDTIVGDQPGSSGTVSVDGAGSTWTNSSGAVVGYYGSGTLTITNGGAVSDGGVGDTDYLGWYSSGTATVDGAGSRWTDKGDLSLGNAGSGTLTITNGGAVSVAGTTWIGQGTGTGRSISAQTAGRWRPHRSSHLPTN